MGLWIIEPVRAADDPAWQGRPQWERVLVRAHTAAEARLAAERLETEAEHAAEAAGAGTPPAEQPGGRASGFSNETLYHVRPVEADGAEPMAATVPEGAILEAVARPS